MARTELHRQLYRGLVIKHPLYGLGYFRMAEDIYHDRMLFRGDFEDGFSRVAEVDRFFFEHAQEPVMDTVQRVLESMYLENQLSHHPLILDSEGGWSQ